jgi:hypothetical protein
VNYYDPKMAGTENYWKHPFGFKFTDDVKNFVEDYKAWWILDVVGSYMPKFKKYSFLLITFDVENEHCTFTAKEDLGQPDIAYQFIEYTDLAVSIQLYLDNGVLMFPGSY